MLVKFQVKNEPDRIVLRLHDLRFTDSDKHFMSHSLHKAFNISDA